MAAKLQRENLNSNAQQMNEGSNNQSFFPALLIIVWVPFLLAQSCYMCTCATLVYAAQGHMITEQRFKQ